VVRRQGERGLSQAVVGGMVEAVDVMVMEEEEEE
jgi:hypothetical protein